MTTEPINDKTEGTTLHGRAVKLLVSSGRYAHIGLRAAETVRWRLREVVPERGDATEFRLDEATDGGWAPLAAGQPLLANVAAAFLDWKPQAFIRIGGGQCLVECEDTASEPATPNAAPCPVCGTPIIFKYSMVEQRRLPYDSTTGACHECDSDKKYPLTWAEALNQMVTHGAICEPDDGTGIRYQHVEGVWRVWVVSAAGGWPWVEILMHFTTPQQRQLTECKWRVTEKL